MAMFAAIQIKGVKSYQKTLERIGERFAYKWSRGAVAEAANIIRDRVRANAAGVGLNRRGRFPLPGGGSHVHRGRIPGAVHAYVRRGISPVATGVVGIKNFRGGPGQTFHWRWVEFGSINNAPRPFFRPGFRQSRAAAMAAMKKVYQWQIAHAARLKVSAG